MTPDSAFVSAVAPSPNFDDRRGRRVDALILHYTGMRTGELARARLCDAAAQVSCHYLVWEDGRIEQLVAEAGRAWHAGRSFWAGESDINAVSVGIEIVNGGHDFGCPPYPPAQIAALTALARDICARHAIAAKRVLAHSDVAPDRKCDPGEWFPWAELAAAGVGFWPEAAGGPDDRSQPDDAARAIVIQERLAAFGYFCPASGAFDAATIAAIRAFQRHFRPERVDGIADLATLETLRKCVGY